MLDQLSARYLHNEPGSLSFFLEMFEKLRDARAQFPLGYFHIEDLVSIYEQSVTPLQSIDYK